MKCHYLGVEDIFPNFCPNVAADKSVILEPGPQKILRRGIAEVFPDARIVRMDVDMTRRKGGQHEAILKRFENERHRF